MSINLKDYLRPKDAMEVVGLKKSRFYEIMPWFISQKAVEKRGNNTYIKKQALLDYNNLMHQKLYG